MEQRAPYFLKTAALAVWSAVLLYFCFTNQLGLYLAPVFRPLVWFAGFALGVVTLCFAIFARPGERCHELECEHHHEEKPHIQIMAFLVLVIPVCIAVFITPETYSRLVIENRGFESSGPGADSQLALWADSPVEASKAVSGEQPEIYAPDAKYITPTSEADVPSEPEDAMLLGAQEPPLPGMDERPVGATGTTGAGTNTAIDQMRGFLDQLEKDEQGYTKLEASDLIYAAGQENFRQAMKGRKVALVGQYYPGSGESAKKLAAAQGPGEAAPTLGSGDYFWSVRMSMVCCAADARPTAVKVDANGKAPKLKDMEWIQTRGEVEFRPAAATNQNPGATFEPWVKAESVQVTSMPDEVYLF